MTKRQFKQSLTFNDYKWMQQAYGIIASLYSTVGNQKKCELSYVKYVQLIERFYHQDSLEASNAYFLVGIYYFEEQMTHKSVACFRKALAIRQSKFGPLHASCGDCLLNLGILYKLRGAPA